jgi:hypothetical protein
MAEGIETTGVCALCKRDVPLVESHILPAFIFRWKKETSATGYLRNSQNPKKRVQDGLKVPLLCIDCERLFNSFDTTDDAPSTSPSDICLLPQWRFSKRRKRRQNLVAEQPKPHRQPFPLEHENA